MTFDVTDYAVLAVTLCIFIAIGLYARFSGERQKSQTEFLLANRSMSIAPVAFSLTASYISAVTLLGVSSENYNYGTSFFIANLGYLLGTPIAAYLFLPMFYKLQATSAYEYLELRFGKVARLSASLVYSIQMILYMGLVVYGPSLAFESVMGIDKNTAIVLVGITVIIYCCIGGMKAVLFTDVFQSILMFVAVSLIFVSGIVYANGFGEILKSASEGGRIDFGSLNPDPTIRHSWFTLLIGGMFTFLSLYGVNQTQIQRMLTVKSLKDAQRSLWWSWPILTLLSGMTCFSGLIIYHYYMKCDPLTARRITKPDQIMPIYVVDALSDVPGFCGLFVAGIYSASLSSVSSCLNSLSAVSYEDYMKPLYKLFTGRQFKSNSSIYPKIIAGVYGVICIFVAFQAQRFAGILQLALGIFGSVGGPTLGLFTLGMVFIRPNEFGSVVGLFSGVFFSLWINFASKPAPQKLSVSVEDCSRFGIFNTTNMITTQTATTTEYFYLFRFSYWYTIVLGFLVTMIVGYALSLCVKVSNKIYIDNNVGKINYDLLLPPIAKYRRAKSSIKNGVRGDNSVNENLTETTKF